jgi:hypothetical protein
MVIFRQRKMASVTFPPESLWARRQAHNVERGRRIAVGERALTMSTLLMIIFRPKPIPTGRNVCLRRRRRELELNYRKNGKPDSGAESRSGVVRSEDDGAHTVVEVKKSVRSHKVLLELRSKRVAPV